MHTPRLSSCLLALTVSSFAGCAQTGLLRSNSPSPPKTVASIGDKSLPIVAGDLTTGSTVGAEPEPLDLATPTGSKISGRVFDDRGKPVPNAQCGWLSTVNPQVGTTSRRPDATVPSRCTACAPAGLTRWSRSLTVTMG